mmetsp:Transcript_31416/g.101575  ORF Transcript_31416/g.101575 Transcript_31416/m.101575 type:complete len:241 (-) Transcript_31416:489-1211(-)
MMMRTFTPHCPPSAQAYHHWLHKNHRGRLSCERELNDAVTEDFVTIGYIEMDCGEIPESAVRNAILPSLSNPRRNLMVPVILCSNNGTESRFSLVGTPSPIPRDGSPVVRQPSAPEFVVRRGVSKPSCINQCLSSRGCVRYLPRGCMRYQPPNCNPAGRHDIVPDMKARTILPRGVHDGNTCTAWVFYALPDAAALQTELAPVAPEPPDAWVQKGADYPVEVKGPRAERGSNDTVMSFLA